MVASRAARTGLRVAIVVAGLVLLPAQAGIADSSDAPAVKLKVGIPQAELDRLRADARSAGAAAAQPPAKPQRAARRARFADRTPRSRPSLAEAASSSRQAVAAGAPPVSVRAAPIADLPNARLVADCFAGHGVETDLGRVHNRFTYCQRVPISAEYWEIDGTGVPVEHVGTTTAKLEVFSQGDDRDRRIRVFARIQEDSVSYDWEPWDQLFVAPNVPLSLIGECIGGFRICAALRGPATQPWVVWDNNDDWHYWDIYNRDRFAEGRDRISYNQWFVQLYSDGPKYRTREPGGTIPRWVRCDSAEYFRRGKAEYPHACIFSEAISRLTYTIGGEHNSIALHIFDAQGRPNTTIPFLAPYPEPQPRDKRIPGEYVEGNDDVPGLHRIVPRLHWFQYWANREHVKGACYKRGAYRHEYLQTGLPQRPVSGVEDCDEYPFASTLEGAAHHFWDFSVKAVPYSENRSAGSKLNNHYINDRVLAWDSSLPSPDETNDRFYVEID
jgi:hypothetical protein